MVLYDFREGKNGLGTYTQPPTTNPGEAVPAEPEEINCRLIYVSRAHAGGTQRQKKKKKKIEKKNIREDTENNVNLGQLTATHTHV